MVRPRILVIRNPIAGRAGSAFARAALSALARNAEATIRDTTARGDAEICAREARGFDRMVVAGGDGTIGEAINGLLARNDAVPPLGVLPLGTANVLAAELGLPEAPEALAETLLRGDASPIHLGLANGRPFASMTGVGFDAHVVAGISTSLKKFVGKSIYGLESARQFFKFGFPIYEIVVDGRPYAAASAIVAKGHFYGGRFVVCPDARLAEPEFQVALFPGRGRWAALGYATALVLGTLPSKVRLLKARTVEVRAPVGDPVQGDGDVIARLPARFEIAPKTLNVVVGGLGQAGPVPI